MMNRNDLIELIIDHAIQLGRYSELYFREVSAMSDRELFTELQNLEDVAIYGGY